MKMFSLLAATMLLTGTPLLAAPQQLESEIRPTLPTDTKTAADEVAIGTDIGDRMTVSVQIAGRGPYRFLVDTGSERTVISRQLAQRLKLESGRTTMLHSVIGANDVATVFIPNLQVSSNNISVVDAPALEASDIGADGMLGIDSLRSQRVMFNFKAKTMSITPANRPPEVTDGQTIVVRARSRNGRLIFTNATVDGQTVTVIVDTGSQVTIGNMALQHNLQKRRTWNTSREVTIESVTGEKMTARVSQLQSLEIGGIHLNELAVAFADAHIFRQLDLRHRPALLLGMNAMRAFDRISIDFAAKKVRFVLPGTSMRDTLRLAELKKQPALPTVPESASISGW
ncbi:MAG: aspartyl protease family protein [Sphingomonas sp.]|uniref:retroviral-like aspartic protease family protein n=1 Tax=Sphingomonas sp. TaxID=28214 RepID=UPI00184AB7C1|nr:retroviral-like aspartic protease family protein [Sphingomonas sp.]MBA3666458.1 aspartyl protease family protein [Sphingomonas sp.]